LGLFSLITIWASTCSGSPGRMRPRAAAWYAKSELTFSDAIAAALVLAYSFSQPSARADFGNQSIVGHPPPFNFLTSARRIFPIFANQQSSICCVKP
jgi:hypothetical protein